MRQLIAVALFCAGLFCIAQAQVPMTGAGLGAPGGAAPAYTGPADCSGCSTSVITWHGLRAMSAADRGNKLINLCDNAGANCADASSDAITGNITITSRGSDSCATADDCLIHTFYDRSGALNCTSAACDVVQATAANMPKLIHNCINSAIFCARFSASQSLTSANNISSTSQPFSGAIVSARTGAFTTAQGIIGANSCVGFLYTASANTVEIFASSGAPTQTASDSNQHSLVGVFNHPGGASSSSLVVDNGTAATGDPGASGLSSGASTYQIGGCVLPTMDFAEGGFWSVAFTGGNITGVYNNQHAYYSVF